MLTFKHRYLREGQDRIKGLVRLCESIPAEKRGEMVEIGCFMGESTVIFSHYFDRVVAIDPWENFNPDPSVWPGHNCDWKSVERKFKENTSEQDNIRVIKAFDSDVLCTFEDQCLDFVYIDADHTREGLSANFLGWWNKVKIGSYIGGHDYDEKLFPQVIEVVSYLEVMLGQKARCFEDCSWIFRREF